MTSVVVIAHRPLASALVAAAEHVYSRDPCAASQHLLALDIAPDADPASALAQAQALVEHADRGNGVLILTDVLGATPGNVAARLARPGAVSVVAGVNLPMLLRALCYGDSSLDALAAKALAGGTQGVRQLGPAGEAREDQPPGAASARK